MTTRSTGSLVEIRSAYPGGYKGREMPFGIESILLAFRRIDDVDDLSRVNQSVSEAPSLQSRPTYIRNGHTRFYFTVGISAKVKTRGGRRERLTSDVR